MQYKIPQDVQREDKIIGPFSLKQFLYLLTGAMVGYMCFSIIGKIAGSTGIGGMAGLITFAGISAFAVIEVQGKPLPEFISAFIVFMLRPRNRIWQKDIYIPDIAVIPSKKKEETSIPKDPSQIRTELEKLSHVLDTRGWGELAKEEERENVSTLYEKVEGITVQEEDKTLTQKIAEGKKLEELETSLEKTIQEKKEKIKTRKILKVSTVTQGYIKKEPATEITHNTQTPAPPTVREEERIKEELAKKAKEVEALAIQQKEEELKKVKEQAKQKQEEIKKVTQNQQIQQKQKISKAQEIKEKPSLEKQKDEIATMKAVEIKQEEEPKTIENIRQRIDSLLEQQKAEREEELNKLRGTVSDIEKIIEDPEKKTNPAKRTAPAIASIVWPDTAKNKKFFYVDEYQIGLEDRVTTPRVEKPTTNIKVKEDELEDVLENTKKTETIEKDLEEIEKAIIKEKTKKKPTLIKGIGSFTEIQPEED
ncbi:hypothetical protein COX95_01735 [bacterium CG_4_10_14_0_2_um_filter_33_32]|nr:MAG: hypothetical protein COU50_00660 [bacterium CG10_big_fil_rev_8_21_14_0_10_33_18]PIZ86278.1 MAG: hypothetical protein COX95_01735 [bacterium CG_4_10_14_0_2_um_filter_33_32]